MFYPTDGSFGGYRHGVWTAPSRCLSPVVAAGLVFYEQPPRVWWAFAYPDHAEHLSAARPLLDRDRAEIARRRAAAPLDRTEPLAVGQAARDLIDRARRWAGAHPELAYVPSPAPPMPSSTKDSHRTAASRPFAGYAHDRPEGGTAT